MTHKLVFPIIYIPAPASPVKKKNPSIPLSLSLKIQDTPHTFPGHLGWRQEKSRKISRFWILQTSPGSGSAESATIEISFVKWISNFHLECASIHYRLWG